jgi:poly(A) polymerase
VPISRAAPPPEESENSDAPPSVARSIEDLLAGFVQSARLPRRIAERCRLLLLAQRTLSGERRRRGAAFRRHPLFGEALTVFELSVEATGEFREALNTWKSGEVPTARPEAAAAEGDAGRKRRRRRRRRGGRKSGSSEAAGASSEAGLAEGVGLEASDDASDDDSDEESDGNSEEMEPSGT